MQPLRLAPLLTALFFMAPPLVSAKPLGNPNAPRAGKINENLGSEPATLNPITARDAYAQEVHNYVLDSLLTRNDDTYEWEPWLAEKIDTSKDGKIFTVHLRKDAVFSDGKPVTADDLKFSFDVIFDPKYNTAHLRPYYESIERVEIVDPHTVRFTVKELYFKNFEVIALIQVLPKHVYGDPTEGQNLNKTVVGSGPYVIDAYEKGKRLILKHNPKWWGWNDPRMKGVFNFPERVLRFVKEEQVEIEMFKTGQLDVIFPTPEVFTKKLDSNIFGKQAEKRQVENKAPAGFGFIGWNLKDPIFQDKPVRRALTHLMNRQMMIEKFLDNKSTLASGPWHKASIYASPKVKPIEFNPKKARELLASAGWADSDKNGVLDKMIDGKKVEFRFTALNPSKDFEKYLTIYKEDLKQSGIDMEIKLLEWNSFSKLLEEQKFQAIVMGWGPGGVDFDPKQIWHSASATKGGSNFISYSNPEVDKLIDKARTQMDRKQRTETLRKVYELIADDAPYVFMFNRKYTFYALWNRVKTPTKTYNFSVGKNYWWMDPKAL